MKGLFIKKLGEGDIIEIGGRSSSFMNSPG